MPYALSFTKRVDIALRALVGGTVSRPYFPREFAVRDPGGYVLGFGQEWAAA
ncbi:MAG TPA: hypothetical protein VFH97_00945 [Gemmatimonadales bacterium]|nr:hypothetical protein [Gemmatimonadales bacterium]